MSDSAGVQYSARSARVRFDPNDLAPGEPQFHITFLAEADAPVFVGEVVVAVQESDDPDEPNLVGTARVVRIDVEHGLIYLDVLRGSFREEIGEGAIATQPATSNNVGLSFAFAA